MTVAARQGLRCRRCHCLPHPRWVVGPNVVVLRMPIIGIGDVGVAWFSGNRESVAGTRDRPVLNGPLSAVW